MLVAPEQLRHQLRASRPHATDPNRWAWRAGHCHARPVVCAGHLRRSDRVLPDMIQIKTIVTERGSHLTHLAGVGPVVVARILADSG